MVRSILALFSFVLILVLSCSKPTEQFPENHPPVIDPIPDIMVNEEETVVLNPTATDPDGNKVTLTYSGWMSSSTYTTKKCTDRGEHTVSVTASDGIASTSEDVQVIVVAVQSSINGISPSSGGYGDTITIMGNSFGSQSGVSGVWFTTSSVVGYGASVTSWSDTTIQVLVPCGLPITTSSVNVQTSNCASASSSQTFANTVTGTCSLGAWQATSSMGTARYRFASVVWNGWVYALGGYNGSYLNSVERAPIQ